MNHTTSVQFYFQFIIVALIGMYPYFILVLVDFRNH